MPPAPPPYVLGRVEFYGAFADLARGKRNWQLAAFLSFGTSAILAAGIVAISAQSRIVPYVVAVDRLGAAHAFGPAERLASVDQRVIVRDLAGFVHDVRSVVADPLAQRDLAARAFAFVGRDAAGFLNAYFGDPANDPRRLGRDLTRLVEVTGVLPLPGGGTSGAPARTQTWKVSWTERSLPHAGGGPPTETAWEGYFTTRVVPPTHADARLTLNPLGVYVTQLHWTQLAVGAPASSATSVPMQNAEVRDSSPQGSP